MDSNTPLSHNVTVLKLHQVFQKCSNVCTDTRKITPDCLFFALHGENFDGNDFALQSLERSASYAVVDAENFRNSDDLSLIFVDDALRALQYLAQYHRSLFEIPIIAITGSNGKTTTKALCAAVLSGAYKTLFTQGNLNNHIGVPLTLLQLKPEHEIAIIEMGANHQGEIDFLCHIVHPTHGLITNMGKAHLEGFGGEEGVRIGKSEMYRYLHKHNGTVFYNANEPHLKNYIPNDTKSISYEVIENTKQLTANGFELRIESTQPYLTCTFMDTHKATFRMTTQIIGIYNSANIATAVCLGKYFKVESSVIAQQISNFESSASRSEIKHLPSGAMLIMDAYNANPSSMRVALNNLAVATPFKKIAILGDMFELGETTLIEHQNIIDYAISLNIDTLITVGENFGKCNLHKHIHFANTTEAHRWFNQQNFGSDTVILLKGSRGMAMEKVL